MIALSAYDLGGFAALVLLWAGLLGLVAWGAWLSVQVPRDLHSLARYEEAMERLARAHHDVLADARSHPGADRHERRRAPRRSFPAG